MKPSICLNMIVRNEGARIERCLASVTATVKCAAILDTGSTDDTIEKIIRWGETNGIPTAVEKGVFKDFSQARNDAFRVAAGANGHANPWCQFALMMDADMELVVDDLKAFDTLEAYAGSYDMIQRAGSMSYANRRIVNLDWPKPPYVGVTHEYIDVPAAGMIKGAWFRDHADGANRVNKYERDAQLLEAALKEEPDNVRYWYYLGNTYRDWASTASSCLSYARSAYQKRIELGGWDEETHSAMMNLADCWKMAGENDRFVWGMIRAYNFRPRRAEPLYELAKFYRERGDHAASLMFSKAGLHIKRPDDVLFVNDFVYSHGLRYEYSVEGFYDDKERPRAAQITDDLALDPTCPPEYRWSARSNLYWYTKPLSHYCGTFRAQKIDFTPPPGYTAMNPSVEECNGRIKCNIRCVNYTIDEHGRYMIGEKGCGDAPIDTRNFVCDLDDDLSVHHAREILWHRPPAAWDMVMGLEDVRLWRYRGELRFSATVREQNAGGLCQMVQGKLEADIDDKFTLVKDWKVISSGNGHEKNWMPMPARPHGTPRYVYRLDTIIEPGAGETVKEVNPVKVHVDDISGSSQLIEFKGGYLSVVHEAANGPDGKRTYWHRFAWFTSDGELRRLSLPFVFLDKQIEFCAGLAYHPNRKDLIISFGVRDAEAHVATVAIEEVAMMCWKFHEN